MFQEEFIKMADKITKINLIKHAFENGKQIQKGVDL